MLAVPSLRPPAERRRSRRDRPLGRGAAVRRTRQAADADFALDAGNVAVVAQVCRRLDGVPLAIELAAARITTMSPAELAAALDRRFEVLAGGRRRAVKRHQTLRATIDWSYDLLDEPHRRLLARLSVFAGGCTRDAAQAVCAGDPIEARARVRTALRPGRPLVGGRRPHRSRHPVPVVGNHPRIRRRTPRRTRRNHAGTRTARPLLHRTWPGHERGAARTRPGHLGAPDPGRAREPPRRDGPRHRHRERRCRHGPSHGLGLGAHRGCRARACASIRCWRSQEREHTPGIPTRSDSRRFGPRLAASSASPKSSATRRLTPNKPRASPAPA